LGIGTLRPPRAEWQKFGRRIESFGSAGAALQLKIFHPVAPVTAADAAVPVWPIARERSFGRSVFAQRRNPPAGDAHCGDVTY
jgi:hypothetical protein